MRGSFFGMNVSLSGLFAAQRNLDTISHNIANIQTDGYSRQAVQQSAYSAIRLYNSTGMVGTGAQVVSVARVRDIYLDQKYWMQTSIQGEWYQKSTLMDQVQTRLDEQQTDGYGAVTNDLYNALEELSKSPADNSIRSVVKEEALSLTTYFNNLAQNLEDIQRDANFDVQAKVEQINSIGHRIEDLNRQIYQVEVLGERANDLRDARDYLVDELSQLVNVEVGEHNYGKLPSGADDLRYYIYIGGTQFLQHYDDKDSVVNELRCVARTEKVNEEDVDGLFDVMWSKPKLSDKHVEITGGELRGILDVRDGNAGQAQVATYDMRGAQATIGLAIGGGAPISVTIDFNEYVRNVAKMSAQELADLLADSINDALAATGQVDISADNRARVTVGADGKLTIDMSGVTDNSGSPGAAIALDEFAFTGSAPLVQALGLGGVAAGAGLTSYTTTKDIVQSVETPNYKGIPYFMRKLNEYVRTWAMAFNEGFIDSDTDKVITADEVLTGHADGFNITQAVGEPAAGVRFFTMLDPTTGAAQGTGDFLLMQDKRLPSLYGLDPDSEEYQQNVNAIWNAYQSVTAKNFTVSSDIQNNVSLIATSAKAGDVEDNTNLLAVIAQRQNRHMFSEGSAEDFMQSLTTDSAVETSQAEFMLSNQDRFISLLETMRQSISGVSQDEEFADMVKQQHAYNASATMINTFNHIYDTLINGLGL